MTEKDNVSMSTVQMKPDYAASEVYSTTSEAPPAYKRQSNSVKVAKIVGLTVITASFILGSFILISTYLQAKASCDQVQVLDSVLEKELMLATLQQMSKEAPKAEALVGKNKAEESDLSLLVENEEHDLDKLSTNNVQNSAEETNMNNNNNVMINEESGEVQKNPKVPLELDLSDLAAALLENNKRSRMNCVLERKHAEEVVDTASKRVMLPFGVNLQTEPKKARITGERISIYCEGDNENDRERDSYRPKMREQENNDIEIEAEPMRPMFIPYQRMPIPFGPMYPKTHMPQRMMPPMPPQEQFMRQMPPASPFQQVHMRPPMPPQIMKAPYPEPRPMANQQHPMQTVRIHVQEMPVNFREIHVADDVPVEIPNQQQEMPHFQIQRLPLGLALQRAGITAEDLRNIQRMAENRITDEMHDLALDVADSAEKNSASSEETREENSDATVKFQQQQPPPQQPSQQQQPPQMMHLQPVAQVPQRLVLQQLPEQPRDTITPPTEQQAQQMIYGRSTFGRSLATPVRIPVPMMQTPDDVAATEDSDATASEAARTHFVQPRSI